MKRTWLPLMLLAGYLGMFNGHLALFENNDPDPLLIFPHRIEAYSEKDQNALKAGIPYYNNIELTQILEDFLS